MSRKPYERPRARPSTLAERLHAILWTHCDATRTESGLPANWYGSQGVLRLVAFEVVKELDTEKRAALAGDGASAYACACVNPPSLAIGETTCPGCGGNR